MEVVPLFGQENIALLLEIINSSLNANLKTKYPWQKKDKEAMGSLLPLAKRYTFPFVYKC